MMSQLESLGFKGIVLKELSKLVLNENDYNTLLNLIDLNDKKSLNGLNIVRAIKEHHIKSGTVHNYLSKEVSKKIAELRCKGLTEKKENDILEKYYVKVNQRFLVELLSNAI